MSCCLRVRRLFSVEFAPARDWNDALMYDGAKKMGKFVRHSGRNVLISALPGSVELREGHKNVIFVASVTI